MSGIQLTEPSGSQHHVVPTIAPPQRLLLRPEEAAKVLGLSRAGIYRLIGRREIRSVKIGAARRIPVDALEAYVAHLPADGTTTVGSTFAGGDANVGVRR